KVWPGTPEPLGASPCSGGVNFAVFAGEAEGVDLCLFDGPGARSESVRLPLRERTDGVWHGFVRGLTPGQLYGFRARGSWEPGAGRRYNEKKLLLDPYARAIGRDLRWDDSLFGYKLGDPEADLARDE